MNMLEELFPITFFASVKIGDDIYFSDWFANGLFKVNLTTEKLHFIGKFIEESEISNLHNHAFVYADEIWFIPSTNGSKIAIYNLITGTMQFLDLPHRKHETKTNKFRRLIQEEHHIWLVPDGYDALLHIDCSTQTIECFDRWPQDIVWENEMSRGFKGAIKSGSRIYLYPFDGGAILSLDVLSSQMERIAVPKAMDDCHSVICTEEFMIFFSQKNLSVIWKFIPRTNLCQRVLISGDVDISHGVYYAANSIGNKLWFLPFSGRDAVCLDMQSNIVSKKPLDLGDIELEGTDIRYQSTNTYNDRIVFTSDSIYHKQALPMISIFGDGRMEYSDWQRISALDVWNFFLCDEPSDEHMDAAVCGRRIYEAVLNDSESPWQISQSIKQR